MVTFKSLGLSGDLLRAVVDAGYATPTPVQAQTIPTALDGQDLIGCAQTGTGKTAAFVLPMLARLAAGPQHRGKPPVRALVVTPTRELAVQVEQAVRTYGKYTRMRSLSIYGGVGMKPQLSGLRRGVDIVVATPGRLLDHLGRGSLDLSRLEVLVLDEADRMLDMGFLPDIRKIVAAAPKKRQTLLFSATMPPAVETLAETILYQPTMVEVGERRNPAETVAQQVCLIRSEQKMELLRHVLATEETESVLVFSRTKHRADRIAHKLGKWGFRATVMHSNRTQNQRQRALRDFKSGKTQIMVATDIAARGIDVESISHVINFDTPNQAEDYIHRIGRTGRARTTGDAITFVTADERAKLRQIERHTGQRLARKVYDGFEALDESEPPRPEKNRGYKSRPYARNGRRHSAGRRR